MSDDFVAVSSLTECVARAVATVEQAGGEYAMNFSLKVTFPISIVQSPELKDVEQLAIDFQNTDKPEHLYINHGSFITPLGLPHVIEELRNKHNGNRAIISLISQEHILKKGDDPFPSFMIMQFSIEPDNTLYVTTYFRALEVSRFFRINIEEIRIVCNRIYSELRSIKAVKLHVFAFRAYINSKLNPLIRPRVEIMREGQILNLLQNSPAELAELLKEKLNDTTVVESNSLKYILDNIIDPSVAKNLNGILTSRFFVEAVTSCLKAADNLLLIRQKVSHHPDIKAASEAYITKLKTVIEEVEKCR